MSEFTRTQIVDGSTGEAINTAISNLPGTGGVVIVEEGTFILTEKMIELKFHQTLLSLEEAM